MLSCKSFVTTFNINLQLNFECKKVVNLFKKTVLNISHPGKGWHEKCRQNKLSHFP